MFNFVDSFKKSRLVFIFLFICFLIGGIFYFFEKKLSFFTDSSSRWIKSDKSENIKKQNDFLKSRKKYDKPLQGLVKVIKVIDGDTIVVELNNKKEEIRFLGLNTPEIEGPYRHEECFGKEASDIVKKILTNKQVYLIPDFHASNRDKYKRLLRYVYLENGAFINAFLIKEGFAFYYSYPKEDLQFSEYFFNLEKKARENKKGLWSEKCNYYFLK